MTDDKRLGADLDYVRTVVERAEGGNNPASIYFLWACISFFGYAIIDYAPEKTGLYWMIAGPVGGILSGILGTRHARRAGQVSRRAGFADFLHWTGLFAAILLLVPLVVTGRLAPDDIPRAVLLLVGYGYWTAGVHLDRRMLAVAAVMGALYLFSIVASGLSWVWTITAAGLAGSLAVAGIFAAARARRGPEIEPA